MVALILFFALSISVVGQEPTYMFENFNKQPAYWSFAEERHEPDMDVSYVNGDLVIDCRFSTLGRITTKHTIKASEQWYVYVAFRSVSGMPNEGSGTGLCAVSGSRRLFYIVYPVDGRYWIGTYDTKTESWTNDSRQDVDGSINRRSSFIRGIGRENSLKIACENGKAKFMINDSLVEELPIAAGLAPLATTIQEIGLCYSAPVKTSVIMWNAGFTQESIPLLPNAFTDVRRTPVHELGGEDHRGAKISPSGQQIYYVATDDHGNDDVWFSDAVTDSTWTVGRPIGPPINDTSSNGVIAVSQDGNELMLWGQYHASGESKGPGFSISRRTVNGWTMPTDIVTNHAVNLADTREECVAADHSVAILSREVAGDSKGGKDLFVSFRQADGSYGPLVNLGPDVNTIGEESGPFLAADLRTLYWYSDHQTYGDADIFVSKRLDDSWQRWSPRMNLGPGVNTPGWDSYFSIHPSGRYAYMNSSDGYTYGIYRIALPSDSASKALLPDPVVIVKGRVLHAKTKQPLGVEIRYDDLATNKNIGTAVSEPKEGRYSVVLTGGRSYGFYASLDGFFPVSDNIELLDLKQYQVVERDLYLEPIAVGAKIRLNNLFFDTDKSELRPESTAELNRLIALLRTRSTITITIDGHTDDRGTDAHNNKLSTDRAASVMAYLVKSGIAPERLTSKGYGKTNPVAKGTTDAARRQNRRVEFSITSI